MNYKKIFGLVFLVIISSLFSVATPWCLSSACKDVDAFRKQMNYFTCGQAFWDGMHTHVKDHLLVGVERLAQQYTANSGLKLAHKELEQVLAFLEQNKEAIIADYNVQAQNMYSQREFTNSPAAVAFEQVIGLTPTVCDGELCHDDLQKLYDINDQREHVKIIQANSDGEQICRQARINDEEKKRAALPRTFLPAPGSWARYLTVGFLLSGVVLGGSLVLAAYKDKIDDALLVDSLSTLDVGQADEQAEKARQELKARLNRLLEVLQQQSDVKTSDTK